MKLILSKLHSIWLILTSARFVAASLDRGGRMKVIRTHSDTKPVTPMQLAKEINRKRA